MSIYVIVSLHRFLSCAYNEMCCKNKIAVFCHLKEIQKSVYEPFEANSKKQTSHLTPIVSDSAVPSLASVV